MPPPHTPQHNRMLTCLAIAPPGRPLQEFANVREALKAFRDAINAHWELYERKILHRDVSYGNMILTDPDQNDRCSGMLIDYDLAVQIGADGKNETSGETNMTSTLEYMAIEILEGAVPKETASIDHTYRHDLESFFYVFLALCIRHRWEEGTKPERDVLRQSYDASYEDIAQIKRGAMGAKGLEIYLLSKFSPVFDCVEELARKLRGILFGKGDLYTETPIDPSTLYKPMIVAFENAIQALDSGKETKHELTSTAHHDAEPLLGRRRKAVTDESNTQKRQKQRHKHQPHTEATESPPQSKFQEPDTSLSKK
ncbi:hypothetical protein LTR70_010266 [Exophiala xenobiotica]|uniref:EKC/KEOPS complex subunit BUD32 n=1 Tax=Lithohypha guttulata TaxID=1690604 RepID=A0ABR0JWD9_9EURO|nr:hypothetical protein LTR24_009673 [Lithohypha guttulata]KAK5309472.1 hypothetical protein LTR70_010266 [Exophiala xenobiotica]